MIILKRCRWHITTYMYIIYAAYFPASSFITLEKTSRYINHPLLCGNAVKRIISLTLTHRHQ